MLSPPRMTQKLLQVRLQKECIPDRTAPVNQYSKPLRGLLAKGSCALPVDRRGFGIHLSGLLGTPGSPVEEHPN